MRTSPIIQALGSAVLASGLVAAGGAAASAEPAPAISDTDQLTAMERDLDMTTAEAKRVLKKEENARTLRKEIQRTLGADFGGTVFDRESGTLTVLVTDSDAVGTVRDTGAKAKVVEYGADQLDAMVDKLDRNAPDHTKGVTSWRPDVAKDQVFITTKPGRTGAAKEFVADAGLDADAVRITQSTESPRLLEDIVGGNAYYIGSGSRCSVGFAVEDGFVTAGHCGTQGASASGTADGTGTFVGSIFPGNDMAHVGNTSNWTPTPNVSGSPETVAGSTEADIGASVCRSGSTTGWHCGTIQAKGESVSYPEGTVNGMTRTTVCAEPGDSGGSYISGDQAQGVTSGGSGDCSSGGTTFFQPVNPILSQWNLSLVTG